MKTSQNEICQQTLEAFIDGRTDDGSRAHLATCANCRQMVASISALAERSSAYEENEHLNLKKQVLNRLKPLIQQVPVSAPTQASRPSWLSWLVSLSLAGAVTVLLLISSQPTATRPEAIVKPIIVSAVESSSFEISVNGKKPATISMDSLVSLFDKETAVIKLADKSEILVEGPARLTVQPRGFHLLAGKVTATVEPDSTPFIATTMHVKIQVLGTIFTCETTASTSNVTVKRGSVKLIANNGSEKILHAGETAQFISDLDPASKTEGIPLISKE